MTDTSKLPFNRITGVIAIIETGHSEDGNQWYRKWSDGWIEQGGVSTGAADNTGATINLLQSYSNTNYTLIGQNMYIGDAAVRYVKFPTKQNSSFTASTGWVNGTSATYEANQFQWYACGY